MAKWYGLCFLSAFSKLIDWDSDVIKVMLCTSAYVPNQDTHQFKSSVTGEVVGTGYVAGGTVLPAVVMTAAAPTYTASTNTFLIDTSAATTTWPTSTITARYAVIYDATPTTDATRPLVGYVDFGVDVVSTASTFTITWDPTGLASVTVG